MATSKYLTKPFCLSTKTINRIFNKIEVDPETGCWLWQGAKDRLGYGYVRFKKDVAFTHRLLYAWLIQPLQAGRKKDVPVLHHDVCQKPSCCNPFHLSLISHKKHMFISPGTIGFVNGRKTHCDKGHLLPSTTPRRCMICYKKKRHLYYIKNREHIIAKSREWKKLNRKAVRQPV